MNPEPPRPPKKGELEEVERALAVLGGRHPEAVRLERETQEAAAKRRAEAEVVSRVEAKKRAKRGAIFLAVAAVVGAVGWKVHAIYAAHDAALKRIAEPASPYVEAGFGGRVDGTLFHAERAEADVEAGTCVVAIGAGPNGPSDVVVERDGETTTSEGILAWCSCAREHVTVTTPHPDGAHAAAMLRTDAKTFAGTYGFARAGLAPKTLVPSPCADEHLDGWLALSKSERRPVHGEELDDAAWLAGTPARATLTAVGFHEIASAAPNLAFAVVDLPKESCALAFTDAPMTQLALRGPGAPRAANGLSPLAFCSSKDATFTVWPKPPGHVTVVATGARRTGGLLGLGEVVARAGMEAPTTWVSPDDLAWDATTASRASGIPDPTSVRDYSLPDRPEVRDARVISFSLAGGASLAPDTTHDLLFYACIRDAKTAAQNMCVQDAQMRWRDTSMKGKSGGAESPLPFWLQSLAGVHDPDLVRAELDLLKLARRLTSAGFDPTVLEALTELPQGVDVKGRAGEDAIVAFTLSPHPPYATPCTDGPPWSLDGEPRVVSLHAGEHVVLRPLVPSSVPPNARRTVVFRRSGK